jgi:hypothetical protein
MTPRRLALQDVAERPDRLLDAGYTRRDEDTTDTIRAIIYEKVISSDESQLKLLVQIHFQLAIHDDVGYEYDELCSYSFNGVYLEVRNRQMKAEDNRYFDEESEHAISVGTLKLDIESLGEVERLFALLKPGVSLW